MVTLVIQLVLMKCFFRASLDMYSSCRLVPEQWNTGHVEGIVARGNFEIDMKWSRWKSRPFCRLLQDNGNTFTGEYDNIAAYTVKKSDGTKVETYRYLTDNKISFPTVAGETYTIDFNCITR